MPDTRVVESLFYLYAHALANQVRHQVARLRSPRYLTALLLAGVYLWWFLIRNVTADDNPISGIVGSNELLSFASALLLLWSARWWLFGSDRGALAFSQAEVHFLFPAPIRRRDLIHVKLVRLQIGIMLNVVIWTLLLRGGSGSEAPWQRAIALWVLFSTIAFHRLGASLVRSNMVEHGSAGTRRSLLPVVVYLLLLSGLAWAISSNWAALSAAAGVDMRTAANAVASTFESPIATLALWPVRAVVAPVVLAGRNGWLLLFAQAAAVLAVHYLWLIHIDSAFEEAALEATRSRAERIHRFRTAQQAGQIRSRKGKLAWVPRLSPTGRPETAIAWKNIVAALRGGTWRTQFIMFMIAFVVVALVARRMPEGASDFLLGIGGAWGGMLLFLGPLWMRYDLRLDLQQLELIKAMPVKGWRVVAAEISAVTLLQSLTVWLLILFPAAIILQSPESIFNLADSAQILLAAVIAIPVINALMFTIANGFALLFPAWVRLGTQTRGGFDTMGQNLLTMGATLLIAAVAMVFPVLLTLALIWFSASWTGWMLPVSVLAGGLLLLAELAPVILWLGSVLDKTDVNDVAMKAA